MADIDEERSGGTRGVIVVIRMEYEYLLVEQVDFQEHLGTYSRNT